MRRRKHAVSVKTGMVDWTTIPVTKRDLETEWKARKEMGFKRCFVSFLKGDTEYIYAMRFLKADLKENKPVAQLAFIRTKEGCWANRKMNYNYLCGYILDFDGGVKDFHQPKSKAFELQYAVPTLMDKIYESEKSKNRINPFTMASLNKKYGMRAIKELKYLPDDALFMIDQDPTYYLGYIMKNSETVYVAEMLSKLGHPECLKNLNWFNLSKKELIAMVRYAQKAKMQIWNYNTIAYNLKRNPPEKAYEMDEINKLGRIRNSIKWAKDIADQKEIINYLDKQNETLNTYEDYFRMRDELQLDYESHSARFPSNLTRAHQELVKETEAIREKERTRMEEEDNRALADIANKVIMVSEKYIPLIPKSRADFRYYGKVMDDCLGCDYWAKDVIEKRDFIFLLAVDRNGITVPYMACDVSRADKKLKIKQLYLQHNEPPSAEERRYVKTKILPQLEAQVL